MTKVTQGSGDQELPGSAHSMLPEDRCLGPPLGWFPSLGKTPVTGRAQGDKKRWLGAVVRGGIRRDHPELHLEAHSVIRDQAERRVEAAEKGGSLRAPREALVLALKVKKERHPDLLPLNLCRIPTPSQPLRKLAASTLSRSQGHQPSQPCCSTDTSWCRGSTTAQAIRRLGLHHFKSLLSTYYLPGAVFRRQGLCLMGLLF